MLKQYLSFKFYCITLGQSIYLESVTLVKISDANKKNSTSPPTVTILDSKTARSKSDSGIWSFNNMTNINSRTPMPAGAPGVTNPVSQAIMKAALNISDFRGVMNSPLIRLSNPTKIMPEIIKNIMYNPKVRAIVQFIYSFSPTAMISRRVMKDIIATGIGKMDMNCGSTKIEKSAAVMEMSPSSHIEALASGQPLTPADRPIACLLAKCMILPGTYLASCVNPYVFIAHNLDVFSPK